MNNRGVSIKYGDVAPGAKETFDNEVILGDVTPFSNGEILKQYNANFVNYANPCELYQTMLDGSASAFPESPEDANIGIWSEDLSDEYGDLPFMLVLEFDAGEQQFSSQGVTLTFDTDNNIYATQIQIQWIRTTFEGIEILANETFYPDSPFYFCHHKVENFTKIRIAFFSINMPHNRLKFRAIDFGYGTYFTGRELRNAKVRQSIDPISGEIAINTLDFTLDSKTNIEYSFLRKQPLTAYFNGNLIATTFVTKSSRKAEKVWDIQSEDYISILDSVAFDGGMYVEKNAVELINEISTIAKVPFEISDEFATASVTGYIPYTTCREALMQIAFAIMAVVDTSNSEKVKVYVLSDNVSQTIPKERVYQGQTPEYSDTVTSVELTAHAYTPSTESVEVYNASENGIGDEILVRFSEPLHSLSISNGTILLDDAQNPRIGANYAYIKALDGCILSGKKYNHTQTVYRRNNPIVAVDDLPKAVEIKDATLVSNDIAQNILDHCYDYVVKNEKLKTKIVEGLTEIVHPAAIYGVALFGMTIYDGDASFEYIPDAPINVGDRITVNREYLGDYTGRIIESVYNLNGNILAKELVIV